MTSVGILFGILLGIGGTFGLLVSTAAWKKYQDWRQRDEITDLRQKLNDAKLLVVSIVRNAGGQLNISEAAWVQADLRDKLTRREDSWGGVTFTVEPHEDRVHLTEGVYRVRPAKPPVHDRVGREYDDEGRD